MKRALFFLSCAWVTSLVGALMSLYFGEVLQFAPCQLCWYQRMALFPLALLLGVALYRSDLSFLFYGMVLAAAGEVFALYHFIHGLVPGLQGAALCRGDCEASALKLFGLIPFPLLSAIGFGLVFAFLWMGSRRSPN